MGWAPALRLAVGTLTVLPSGAVTVDRPTAGRAMLLAPLAVLPLGLLAAGLAGAGTLLGWPGPVLGLVCVAGLALATRGLHLDGLADTVDGLGSGWDRERALAVMRRGDVGPMGAVALVLVLGIQASVIGTLATGWPSALGVAVLVCCSRAVLAVVCRRGVSAARPSGLGAAVAGSVPAVAAVTSQVVTAAVLALLWRWLDGAWWAGLLTAVAAAAAGVLLVAWCVRRFGGVTGDVMGAAVEVSLTVLLLGACAGGGWAR
jgi:adenosylcobinamide-GDP ribazoletransferase